MRFDREIYAGPSRAPIHSPRPSVSPHICVLMKPHTSAVPSLSLLFNDSLLCGAKPARWPINHRPPRCTQTPALTPGRHFNQTRSHQSFPAPKQGPRWGVPGGSGLVYCWQLVEKHSDLHTDIFIFIFRPHANSV